MFNFVKSMYPLYWNKENVQMSADQNWITQEQADEILKGGDNGRTELG